MRLAPYRVHKLIQDLMHDPKEAAAFAENPEPAFESYGLLEEQKALLRDGSLGALNTLAVHPNLQMKYLRIRSANKPAQGAGPLADYLDRLMER